MKNVCCVNCKFYSGLKDGMGLCHRYPPKLYWREDYAHMSDQCTNTMFPIVEENCWCGEYSEGFMCVEIK